MWQRMTIDEYAEFERANGTEAINVDGIWWRRARAFFYQPLFPFLEIIPGSVRPPRGALLGGFQHLVPAGEKTNSQKHFFIWDEVQRYSLDRINHRARNFIKKGMKHFSVREIEDPDELVASGHPVYRSFYERTGYRYKKERTDKEQFRRWVETLYRFSKIKVLGAYHADRLCAIDISYLVQDVLIDATFFGQTEYLKYRVSDVMIHALRERAAASPLIGFIFKGPVTGIPALDESKRIRGCKVLSRPALYQVNPVALLVLSAFMKSSYEKLVGSRLVGHDPGRPERESTPGADEEASRPSSPPASGKLPSP
jgi:hypothetical protein